MNKNQMRCCNTLSPSRSDESLHSAHGSQQLELRDLEHLSGVANLKIKELEAIGNTVFQKLQRLKEQVDSRPRNGCGLGCDAKGAGCHGLEGEHAHDREH